MTGRGETVLSLLYDDDMASSYPDPEKIKKEADYTLADIYGSEEYGGKVEVSYEYDHGDSWDHQIAFLGRADPSMRRAMSIPDDMQVVCLGGDVRIHPSFTIRVVPFSIPRGEIAWTEGVMEKIHDRRHGRG